ncbi:MAG TPA: Ig-like domain-containing protein, partial [Gemmatimonadaceae bacterium]|nr:Ig-like domain-containing protein [Gemmatimonadaceae bacterium]
MRRLIIAALALLGCAQPGAPPGGPEDKVPPKLLSVSPESGAVNVRAKEVEMKFDEVLSERPAASGASTLDQLVLISPRDGDPHVGWHRSTLTIHGRHDFLPNTAYTVTLLPGLADLRGNVRKEGTTIVFSTGPTIPSTRLTGIVFDWGAGRPLANAAVMAVARPDSDLRYVARADSNGRFALPALRPGTYTVTGFADANNDWAATGREAYDTAHVVLRDSARVELLAFVHDTIGPTIQNVATIDSVTIRATFDKPLDPAQKVDASLFTLRASDSTVVPLKLAMPSSTWDSTHVDTTKRADTTAAARLPAGPPPRPGQPVQPGQPPGARAGRDTTHRAPAPRPSRPVPVSEVVIVTARPLTPGGTYRLSAHGVRNLLGHASNSSRSFVVPKGAEATAGAPGARPKAPRPGGKPPAAKPPADTGRARADTARR